jgi:uncharacterized protein YkwD
MKYKLGLCVTVCFAISVILTAFNLHTTQAQGEKPLRNEARAHPDVYAKYLKELRPFFNDKQYKPNGGTTAFLTNEGWAAVEDAISFLRTAKSQKPLILSKGLSLAAAVHVKDQSGSGSTGHKSPSNSYLEARTSAFGIFQGAVGENLSYGNQSPRERVLTWLIDDGFASRGHRRRLLSADYAVAGVSCGSHPQYEAMCVLTLAESFTDFPTKAAGIGPSGQPKNERSNPPARKARP